MPLPGRRRLSAALKEAPLRAFLFQFGRIRKRPRASDKRDNLRLLVVLVFIEIDDLDFPLKVIRVLRDRLLFFRRFTFAR